MFKDSRRGLEMDVPRAPPSLPEWEYLPDGWPRTDPAAAGWNDPSIVRAMVAHWEEFSSVVRSKRPLGIYPLAPHGNSLSGHNLAMTLGYVLARAAIGRDRVSVLDWGGATGHYALIAQALVPEVPLDITIRDLPDMCQAGHDLLPLVSFTTEDAQCFGRRYDVVIASSSLQYAETWRDTLRRLAAAAESWLFVTRLPAVRNAPSFVVVQRPHAYGYQTEYASWVLNRTEFITHVEECGLVLEREFIAGGVTEYAGGPEPSEESGFLFRVPHREAAR